MTVNAKNIIDKALLADDFMEIMDDYQARQQGDPNFDPSTRLYDLYDELVFIYEKAKDNDK
jgi:hypothetical protein